MTNTKTSIERLLKDFAAAMQAWESDCLPYLSRTAKKSQLDESDLAEERRIRDALREVYREYCVSWDNPERNDYGDPPDYHPEYFEILEITVKGKKATAKVRQPRFGRNRPSKGGGIVPMNIGEKYFVYHLKLTDDGWRLEDRRESHRDDGTVIKMGL